MVNFTDDHPEPKNRDEDSTDASGTGIEADTPVNGTKLHEGPVDNRQKKRRKHKEKRSKQNGLRIVKKRRLSLSKAARDPRDEASPVELDPGSRSPSPVIDFDGLSRPSRYFNIRIEHY